MTSRRPLVSIITPTFNRAHTLRRVYDGLLEQHTVLEWIVVDDGSADGTEALVTALSGHAPFPVRYLRQDHAGKHMAVNKGVAVATGEMVGLHDSDDTLLPGALDLLVDHWLAIPDRSGFVGVTGLDVDETGAVMGTRFPADVVDAPWQEMVYRHHITGDKWGILRADLLRERPFHAGKDYVFEGEVWRDIGRRYRTRYVNVPVLSCSTHGDDRLGRRPFAKIAHGAVVQNTLVLNEDIDWLTSHPMAFVRSAANLTRALLHVGEPLHRHPRRLRGAAARLLWAACVPLGWLLYRRDLMRAGRAAR